MSDLHRALAEQALWLVPLVEAGRMNDKSSTAFKFACMALVAMDVAETRIWGCQLTVAPCDVTKGVDPAGLWIGDASMAFLAIGSQIGDISRPQAKGRPERSPLVQIVGGRALLWATFEHAVRDGTEASHLDANLTVGWLDVQRRILAQIDRGDARFEVSSPAGLLLIHTEVADPFRWIGWIENGVWSKPTHSRLWRNGMVSVPLDSLNWMVADANRTKPDDVARLVENVWCAPTGKKVSDRAGRWFVRMETDLRRWPEDVRSRRDLPIRVDLCACLEADWPRSAKREFRNHVEARWRVELGWDSGAPIRPLFHDRLAGPVAGALVNAA